MKFILFFAFSSKKDTIIYCLDSDNAIFIESLKGDFTFLLGMFFIDHLIIKHNNDDNDNSKKQEKNNNSTQSGVPFCLIFKKKIIYFKISESNTKNTNQHKYFTKQTTLLRISLGSIINYEYCPQYMILCCEKSDYSFVFYNLSNEKYYFKNYIVKIGLLKTDINTESAIKGDNNCRSTLGLVLNNTVNYKRAQFFLQTM